jgi:hypothetical protein
LGAAAGTAGTTAFPSTGLLFGDGGIPSVSFGGRGPLPLLRLPGTGGLRRGTGEDDMARLFCLSPGKNNSLGSAKVARSATFELDTLNGKLEN